MTAEIAAIILAGGWLEGLYVGCKVSEHSFNKELIGRIADQRLS
jgi:hypothetical protein